MITSSPAAPHSTQEATITANPAKSPRGGHAAAASAFAVTDGWERFFEPFLGDLREQAAAAGRTGKKALLVMYHFEKCPACARMKRDVLPVPAVQDYYRRNFHAIAIDIRGAQEVVGLDGRARPESDHARAVGIRGTPTFAFHGPDGKALFTHVGGIYDPQEFVLLGEFVATDAYRSASFADYKQSRRKRGG